MSDENVGGLVELLPCPFCGGEPNASAPWSFCGDMFRIVSCRGSGTELHEPISMESRRWNTRVSARGQPVVDAAMIERAEAAWFSEPRTGNLTVAIQRMLTAALKGATP